MNPTKEPPGELTPEERMAVRKGRAELERGEFFPLEELLGIVQALRNTPNNKHPKRLDR